MLTRKHFPGALLRLTTAIALAVCLLTAVVGCAPARQGSATAEPASFCPPDAVKIGGLDDPSNVFCRRPPEFNTVTVTATAYVAGRGKRKRPARGAWGDVLDPKAKTVAVSSDLMEMGLTRGAKLRINGMEGEFTVLDTMHPRKEKTIDIFFGQDRKAALQWGRRTLTISWE